MHRRQDGGVWRPTTVLLALVPLIGAVAVGGGVPVGDVEVWGALRPTQQQVEGALRVHVRTPLGRVPITGRANATYTCNASFIGSLHYGPIVRLLAHFKHVDLVSKAEGAVVLPDEWDCRAAPAGFSGRVTIHDSVLTGFLRLDDDSIPLTGDARTVDDSTYRTIIQAERAVAPFSIRLSLYER
jgi:hypothetical protein